MRSILSRARYTRPADEKMQIVLVGTGGTGGWLAPALARIVAEQPGVALLFVDPDTVEEKNLARQNFCHAEIGLGKAHALAARYSQAWGVDIVSLELPFEQAAGELNLYSTASWTLLVGCVDNAAARISLSKTLQAHRGRVGWLDCGNSAVSGQVVFGTVTEHAALARSFAARGLCSALPAAPLVYPNLLKAKPEETAAGRADLSCAELALRDRQIAVVNKQAAVIAEQYVLALVAGELDRFRTTFSLADGVVHTDWISPVDVSAALEGAVCEAALLGRAPAHRAAMQT